MFLAVTWKLMWPAKALLLICKMDLDNTQKINQLSLDYRFSEQEIRLLARFFRKNQEQIPDGLLDFSTKIERAIYNSLSIAEAQAFYS